jgi:hypothetical protein
MHRLLIVIAAAALSACGNSPSTRAADHASLPAGCPVRVFEHAPPMPLENIGTVSAVCDANDPDDVCTRQLEDEVCKLGGDVVWGVGQPLQRGDKRTLTGRAAHTK